MAANKTNREINIKYNRTPQVKYIRHVRNIYLSFIIYFNTTVSTLRGSFRQIGIWSRGRKIGFHHSPAAAHITQISHALSFI